MIVTHIRLIALSLSVVLGCAHPTGSGVATHPIRGNSYCEIAVAALRETIKNYDDQPYGLEQACVRERAMSAGKIYVDARFGDHWETVHERSCAQGDYVIRFDFDRYEPSPTNEVVVLLMESENAQGRRFNAVMEDSNWASKRPGVMAVSGCGSAFGIVRRSPSGWAATIGPPERNPDDL